MQSHASKQFSARQPVVFPESHDLETRNSASSRASTYDTAIEAGQSLTQLTRFQSQSTGCMTLYADTQTVARYLDTHHGWFCRCAHPMIADPLGDNGYDLGIGRFGAFGYQVEPKVGLELLPQDQGVYRIQTIPIPHQGPEPYKVDFQSALELVEAPVEPRAGSVETRPKVTQVEWHLELTVLIQFPKFIYKLPQRLIQQTGDRLLTQIVRQVSHRLTTKVQEDFHQSLGLSYP